jgi:predicted DNA-binding transcriptional regulator YafY
MREAKANRKSGRTARELAKRYGISTRTVYRYVKTVPVPAGLEYLRLRLQAWAKERDLPLTYDDMQTLMLVIARHRDLAVPDSDRAA